jgi:hypothetical protein
MRFPTLQHVYAFQIMYPLSLFSVKASILALYYRIFSQTRFRWRVYSVAGFDTVYTIVVILVNVSRIPIPVLPVRRD